MAVRIRSDGRVFCAALRPEQEGDIYVDDTLHYHLSVEAKVLVTEPHEQHMVKAEWWWKGKVPPHVEIDPFYLKETS